MELCKACPKRKNICPVVRTHLVVFNDLFSSMIKINLGFATTQTKMAIEPVLKEYPAIFKGFKLELRDLNCHVILENSEGIKDSEVIQALEKLTSAMYEKCKALVGNVGVFVSDASRKAVIENYKILEEYGALDVLPREFSEFKGGSKTVKISYGREELPVDVPLTAEVLTPKEAMPLEGFEDKLEQRLENPIGTQKLEDMIEKNQKVAIIIDDHTRKTPTKKILPFIIDRVERVTSNITIVIATGLHRKPTDAELLEKIGGYSKKYPVIVHDAVAGDLVSAGKLITGGELKINREIMEADFAVAIGTIEPHPYAGYSGGYKSILPGVSGRDAIVSSHMLNIFPGCQVGKVSGNPMRAEISAAGERTKLKFIVNTILNRNGDVAEVVCGAPIEAFEEGVKICERMYSTEYGSEGDIVVLTPGGYPKDSSLYLALRALKTAELVLNEGGVIILVAKCEENKTKNLIKSMKLSLDRLITGDPRDVISLYIMSKYPLILVSDIGKAVLKKLDIKASSNFKEAMREAMLEVGVDPHVIVIPDAYIVPKKV